MNIHGLFNTVIMKVTVLQADIGLLQVILYIVQWPLAESCIRVHRVYCHAIPFGIISQNQRLTRAKLSVPNAEKSHFHWAVSRESTRYTAKVPLKPLTHDPSWRLYDMIWYDMKRYPELSDDYTMKLKRSEGPAPSKILKLDEQPKLFLS